MTTRYFQLNTRPALFAPASRKTRRPKGAGRGWLLLAVFTAMVLFWLLVRWVLQPSWLTRLPEALLETLDVVDLAATLTLGFVWLGLGLRRRWLAPDPSPPISLDELYTLSPAAFEHYVAGLFRQKGYLVRVRGSSGDHGVDLEVRDLGGKRAIVQCKRYQNTVGEDLVRELFGTLIHERAARAFLVTTANISASAYEWAQGKPITLIDGSTLVRIAAALSPIDQSA